MKLPRPDQPTPCACERPSLFASGVPGILAHIVDGRLASDSSVECCPVCRRFPTVAAALARLEALGIAGERPSLSTSYTVHCLVMVCIKRTGIVAGTPREAARLARQSFCWEQHGQAVEFVDEIHEMLVDLEGVPDYSRSVAFTADLEPVR
ncbi:MAG: hypothetical protein SH850_01775 [Planctomycetaceae bacterium]|nr:hypothetical protein [Planctomycetaceae bacterium]